MSDDSGASLTTIVYDINENEADEFVTWDESDKTFYIEAGEAIVESDVTLRIDITLTD